MDNSSLLLKRRLLIKYAGSIGFLEKGRNYYIATEEGDQPRVRPFGTAHIFEDKLYIQTGKKKLYQADLYQSQG
jgi:uncharacterized pyridoxamine 5'-phosphate oxidase family protein